MINERILIAIKRIGLVDVSEVKGKEDWQEVGETDYIDLEDLKNLLDRLEEHKQEEIQQTLNDTLDEIER